MIIFDANDPLVLNGTYDREGYKPGERERIRKQQQRMEEGDEMAKKKQGAKARKVVKSAAKPSARRAKGRKTVCERLQGVADLIESHRVTVHKPNASTSTEVAHDPLPSSSSGPIVLPTAAEALVVLKGLAELNDRATAAHAFYADLKERTKTAKEKWEGLAEEVQRKLRLATHGSDLPLFDVFDHEADRAEMLAGPITEAGEPAQDAPGDANGDQDGDKAGEEPIPF